MNSTYTYALQWCSPFCEESVRTFECVAKDYTNWDTCPREYRRDGCCLVTHTVTVHYILTAFQLFYFTHYSSDYFYTNNWPFMGFFPRSFHLHLSKMCLKMTTKLLLPHARSCGQYQLEKCAQIHTFKKKSNRNNGPFRYHWDTHFIFILRFAIGCNRSDLM